MGISSWEKTEMIREMQDMVGNLNPLGIALLNGQLKMDPIGKIDVNETLRGLSEGTLSISDYDFIALHDYIEEALEDSEEENRPVI